MLSPEQGEKLVRLARDAISSHIKKKELKIKNNIKAEFNFLSGAFVTLEKNGVLRGCIGIVNSVYPVYESISDSAVNAAFSDPRFSAMDKEELDLVTISVSVLSNPTLINVRNPDEYIKQIQIGKDGLLIKGTYHSGLLLPIVAVEQKWDVIIFLRQSCIKAGMPAESWRDFNETRVYKFQTQVFSEKSPNGEVVQEM